MILTHFGFFFLVEHVCGGQFVRQVLMAIRSLA